jgi:hypothetical protein
MKMRNANDARFYFELAVFNAFKYEESIPLNRVTEVKPVVSTPQPIKKVESPQPTVTKDNPLPPLNKVFNISKYPITNHDVKTPVKMEKHTTVDKNALFYQIAYNNSKKTLENAKNFLNKIKDDHNNKTLSFIALADRVLVASNNGVVLLFDDDVDAELLNVKNKTYDFLVEVKKYFNQPMHVIGLEKENGKKLANEFMKLKKQGETFEEPDINPLIEIIKANNSVEQLAMEIFGEK